MDAASPTILVGTLIMLLPYLYFYILYREKFMGIWLLSWLIFGGRMILFDYGPFTWKNSDLGLTCFQLIIIVNGLTFVWGTHIFINKLFNRNWIWAAAGVFTLSITGTLLQLPLSFKILPPLGFACFVCLWIGRIFTHHLRTKGIGKHIAGYALIFWGLLTLFMTSQYFLAQSLVLFRRYYSSDDYCHGHSAYIPGKNSFGLSQ